MINLSTIEISAYYSSRVPMLKQAGSEWRGPCPVHHGKRDSFAVEPDTGRWYCHSDCARGGDVPELEIALSGGDFKTAKAESVPRRWSVGFGGEQQRPLSHRCRIQLHR